MVQKLLSRKFIVTILTIGATISGLNLDNWHIAIVGGVAALYVLAEALVDHASASQIANDVQKGLAIVGSVDASHLDAATLKTLIEKLGVPPASTAPGPSLSLSPSSTADVGSKGGAS